MSNVTNKIYVHDVHDFVSIGDQSVNAEKVMPPYWWQKQIFSGKE